MKLLKRIQFKFSNAINGISAGLKHDRSIEIQFAFMVLAILAAWFFKISKFEWIIIILVSGLVVAFEFINSSIELLCDFVTDEQYSPIIKKVKDLSAAAVLIIALTALLTGLIIFSKYIL